MKETYISCKPPLFVILHRVKIHAGLQTKRMAKDGRYYAIVVIRNCSGKTWVHNITVSPIQCIPAVIRTERHTIVILVCHLLLRVARAIRKKKAVALTFKTKLTFSWEMSASRINSFIK